jgi:hypothetical protein
VAGTGLDGGCARPTGLLASHLGAAIDVRSRER